jgi:hypothetical protein
MKRTDGMKDRKLLIRLYEKEIERIRPNGLYTATAKVTRFYKSTKWVDLDYVIPDEEGNLEPGKLHLERDFYRTDCTPKAFPDDRRRKRRGGLHCGWAMYRENVADIGENIYRLMDSAVVSQ